MTNTNAIEYPRPAGWVSTFGLYNAGMLSGYWTTAGELPETIEDFRAGMESRGLWSPVIAATVGDELWCFDVEHMPGGETSPLDVNAYGAAIAQAVEDNDIEDGELLAALLKRAADNGYTTAADLSQGIAQAMEQDRGAAESIEQWAYDYLDETGQLDELPEWAQSYATDVANAFAHDMSNGGEISIAHGRAWGNA